MSEPIEKFEAYGSQRPYDGRPKPKPPPAPPTNSIVAIPTVSPKNLTEGEKYLITYTECTTKQTIEQVLFWIGGEWRTTNNKYRQIMGCVYFADQPIQIYGPIKLNQQ